MTENWPMEMIDWCLMPTLAVFQLYRGNEMRITQQTCIIYLNVSLYLIKLNL